MIGETLCFSVDPLTIPFSSRALSSTLTLTRFQKEVQDSLSGGKDILIYAPTGSGKTLTLLLNPECDQLGGFVAIYPNNTLLKNQMETVKDMLTTHLGARKVLEYPPEEEGTEGKTLVVYELNEELFGEAWCGAKRIALIAFSGRYITSEGGGPKRKAIYGLARKVLDLRRKGGLYVISFATPDTYLLVYTGAYRDFEGVGKTLHNILVEVAHKGEDAKLEEILRKTAVLTRAKVAETLAFAQRILSFPLFIDEFHLYGPYEIDALTALIEVYKTESAGPVVLSSATPARETVVEMRDYGLEPVEIRASSGPKGLRIRGRTEIVVVPIRTRRRGITSYFEASGAVPEVVRKLVLDDLRGIGDKKALIVLEKLWMVPYLARELIEEGLRVQCVASILPEDLSSARGNIVVGSEATTQGINLGRVVLGVTGGTSSEDVIQRIGRVGRAGTDSKVYLVLPEHKVISPDSTMSYDGLVDWVSRVYPDYPKRRRDVSRLFPRSYHVVRRKIIEALAWASLGRVSGAHVYFERINLSRQEARELLDSFVGPPVTLTKLLIFRRFGFEIRFRVTGTNQEGSSSIGLIARNFKVQDFFNGNLMIDFQRARDPVSIEAEGRVGLLSGKLVDVGLFLNLIRGKIKIGDVEIEGCLGQGTLGYVGDFGRDLAEYLSYTGEGAIIRAPRGERYALIFI